MSPQQENFRRKYPRRSLKKTVGVLARGTYFLAIANELGEGGLSFMTDLVLSEGDRVVLTMQIPGGDLISVKAAVKSVTKIEGQGLMSHGISFEDISFSHKRQIRAFVSARTQEYQA